MPPSFALPVACAQWPAGTFVAINENRRGRLVAATAADGTVERVKIELPSVLRPTGITVREVAFCAVQRIGPPSDPELCARWDGVVRHVRIAREALPKARLSRTSHPVVSDTCTL